MGQNQQSTALANYQLQKQHKNYSTISKRDNHSLQFALKSYRTYSEAEHTKRVNYFKQYHKKMKDNMQIVKLLEVVEEKKQQFCANDYKVSLIYQHTNLTILGEILERRSNKVGEGQKGLFYFSYEDLCSLLYTCLSALWIVKEEAASTISTELRNYKTIFLTAKDILIMEDGTIKVTDPYLTDFDSRYVHDTSVNYSPEKMIDFNRVDDQKSSVFELGLLMLQISLLQPKLDLKGQMKQQLILNKLQEVKKIYEPATEQIGVNVFDIIRNMLHFDREKRYSLEQAIQYAQEMYEQQSSPSKSTLIDRLSSSHKKGQLKMTNHASTDRRGSPSLKKFYEYKEEMIEEQSQVQKYKIKSPQVSTFVIEEADHENQEQSGMLDSFHVQQPAKTINFNSSIGTAGVFNNLKVNDSYAYETQHNSQNMTEFDQEHLFTDPRLIASIKRELAYLEERKRQKMEKSRVLQRKDRYLTQETIIDRINNSAYLRE